MKNIKFSRSQILRTIRAACIALFFAACAGQANAVPHYTSDFVLSPDGTTVTVAGSPNNTSSAYFVDLAPNAYAFTISSAANIGNTTDAGAGFGTGGDLIRFDNGSVNNAGTLNSTESTIYIGSTSSAVSSSVTNSGSITAPDFVAVNINGNGTVNNVGGGTISGWYAGVYIGGAGGASSVTNAGSITATSTSAYAAGVGLGSTNTGPGNVGTSSFAVVNSGTMTGSATYDGSDPANAWGLNANSYQGNLNIVNTPTGTMSGTATNNGSGAANAAGLSASSYYGNVSITNGTGGIATGTALSSGLETGIGIYAATDFDESYGTITINNCGTATGMGGNGNPNALPNGDYDGGRGYGISASSYYGSIVITNSGTASGSGLPTGGTASGYGIYAQSNSSQSGSAYGNVTITNSTGGIATGTATSLYGGAANAFGISASANGYGNVTITNCGMATGTASAAGSFAANAAGISASSNYGNTTVINNGTATGTASSYDNATGATATGTGISASTYGGTATVINNSTATGTGSGYYSGTGYGIAGSASGEFGQVVVINNNMATGTGTAASGSGYPTGTGYGIYGIAINGSVTIINNGTATGTGTAVTAGANSEGSASGYGFGIFAQTAVGFISIQNYGHATGTGSGFYLGSGSGLYALSTDGGTISIVNEGEAIGNGSSFSSYIADPAYGYGIYAQSDAPITINNLCTATGNATIGTLENPITSSAVYSSGSGILVRSSGNGPILIQNSGTASGYGIGYGTGSAYGYGINVKSSGSATVTINNGGNVFGSGSSYASTGYFVSGTGSGYGIYFQGDGSGALTITNQVSGVIAGDGYSAFGSFSSYGIYLENGTGPATITNSGVIAAVHGVGIDATGYTGSMTVNEIGGAVTTGLFSSTGSGYYVPMTTAMVLGSAANTVNIVGQANNTGLVDGGSSGNNTLTMHLVGMTPAQAAALQTALNSSTGSGYYKAGGVTYSWTDFQHVSGTAVSLEQVVDPGLLNVATKIDNLNTYLGVAYGPFYVAAVSNPEAALNSLVGREFDDALGVISKNDATALSEVFDSRAFDLRTGTGGFDLSGLNITSGSMIASLGATENTLDRLMGNSAMGGTTMSDSKQACTSCPVETNRWGAWASGTVTVADESTTASGPGFNYLTGSPTIGADYRVCNDLAIGALLNYSTTGANFADGSHLGVQTGLAALYATWSDGPWYVNALAGGGISSYNDNRVTLTGATANSSPDGDEVLANLTGGYDFKLGCGWKVSPEGGFLYTHVTENSYTESGAGAYDLTFDDQNIDSLRSKLGFRVIDNFTWDRIAFTPQFRASWYHEILDDSRGVTTSLGGAPALGSFVVQTNSEGRDFADLGAGLSATPAELSGDVTFFVNYDAQVGQDNFVAHTVNGGVRVNF